MSLRYTATRSLTIWGIGILLSVLYSPAYATTYYSDYGTNRTHNVTASAGTHTFEVNGIAQYKWTEWYVNGVYTGEAENDYSGFFAVDPQYTRSFSSGTTQITAIVYNDSWGWEEDHVWNVTVGQPDLTKQSDSINKTTVRPDETLNVNVTVKNQGNLAANSGYVYYYWKKDSRVEVVSSSV